jgi:RsmE family RNA methyltransferase
LRVGLVGGLAGQGTVIARDDDRGAPESASVELDVDLVDPPPAKLPLRVLLALPRPKVLERALVALASLGVAEIVLLNAWRVDKAYWSSPKVSDEVMRDALLEGLAQARDTVLPSLVRARLFRRYLEDELAAATATSEGPRLLAHPGALAPCPSGLVVPEGARATLAIGPEGGWIEPEVESFARAGFVSVSLGPRVLRVETALAALIGRLAIQGPCP